MAGQAAVTRRARKVWWLVAALAGAVYLAALLGATAIALKGAVYLRQALKSDEFRAALEVARHPLTERDLARLLPGIPIYPGARIAPMFHLETPEAGDHAEAHVLLMTPAAPSDIRAFYRSHMHGWELDPQLGGDDTLAFRRGRERCWISVMVTPKLPLGFHGGGRVFTIDYKPEAGKR